MKKIVAIIILKYLRLLAKIQLRKINPIIVGITGSAGKTSTRIAVSAILRTKGKVKESEKANSESGIPLNILGLEMHTFSWVEWLKILLLAPMPILFNWEKYDYYVVEMGIDSPDPPKNMSYLLTILRPHIGIVLNAGLVHASYFDHLVQDKHPARRNKKITNLIAQEKGKLITSMPNKSFVGILNSDQKEIASLARFTKARVITFGIHGKPDLKILTSPRQKRDSAVFRYSYLTALVKVEIKNLMLESNYAYTFGAALCVGVALGIPPRKSAKCLSESFSPPPGRWNIFQGKKGATIIDSSYNASPETMQSALKNLSLLAPKKQRLAVVGDMRELGTESKEAHKSLASQIEKHAHTALLFGEETAKYTLPILLRKGFPVAHYTDIKSLNRALLPQLTPRTWVLVKGSQNTIFLERVVEKLLKNKNDAEKLCRRGKYWDRVRERTK